MIVYEAATIDAGIEALKVSYNEHFEEVFPTPMDGLLSDREGLEEFSRELTASIFGGVGYFYGSSIVDEGFAYEWDEDEDASQPRSKGAQFVDPKELLSATPSRSFFPRGFYW
jgi:mannosyl-oligosaccharide glucosidase